MAREPTNPRGRGDQIGAIRPNVEPIRGTTDRDYPARISGSYVLLEFDRPSPKARRFQSYYNGVRVHRSLDGHTPANRAGNPTASTANLAHYVWESHCNGLFETPVAA